MASASAAAWRDSCRGGNGQVGTHAGRRDAATESARRRDRARGRPRPGRGAVRREAEALQARLDELKAAHAAEIAHRIRSSVSRAGEGDLGSWQMLCGTVRDYPRSSPDGLLDRLIAAATEALIAADPVLWSRPIDGGVKGEPSAAAEAARLPVRRFM
jgi:hypothetical protein